MVTGVQRVLFRSRSSIAVATKDEIDFKGMDAEDIISQPSADLEVWIGTRTKYAIYVEFGTRYMGERAYLRPAFEQHRGKIAEEVKKEASR